MHIYLVLIFLYFVFYFLREKTVQDHAKRTDPVGVMDFLRTEKNSFRAA